MPTVVLGISSGIAAFKMVELTQLLKKSGVDTHVVMTPSATRMVPAQDFEQASGHKVWSELYEPNFNYQDVLKTRQVDHIQVADSANLLVISPATANIIAKLANGLADDFLTTMTLAVTCPILIFPSMNVHMWHHPSVQQNLEKLRSYGYIVIDPDSGPLACGYDGKGRLPEPQAIFEVIQQQLQLIQLLKGKKVLITFGGTQEKIDQVRFITNRSSGKMGAAIADACFLAGAEVIGLRAVNAVQPRFTSQTETFETSDDLEKLVQQYVPKVDIFFHLAAVSDFMVEQRSGKISSNQEAILRLQPRRKILDQIKKWNPEVQLIAFKAEVGLTEKELTTKAQKRLQESDADVIVANDVGQDDRGFQSDDNEVLIIKKDGSVKKISLTSKINLAQQLVNYLFA